MSNLSTASKIAKSSLYPTTGITSGILDKTSNFVEIYDYVHSNMDLIISICCITLLLYYLGFIDDIALFALNLSLTFPDLCNAANTSR